MLHAVCLVPVATLRVMLSLMLCCPARALGYTSLVTALEKARLPKHEACLLPNQGRLGGTDCYGKRALANLSCAV